MRRLVVWMWEMVLKAALTIGLLFAILLGIGMNVVWVCYGEESKLRVIFREGSTMFAGLWAERWW